MITAMFFMRMKGLKNRKLSNQATPVHKEGKETEAFISLGSWLKGESNGLAMLMQNVLNGGSPKKQAMPEDLECAVAAAVPGKTPESIPKEADVPSTNLM